jgi:hypothetical protein
MPKYGYEKVYDNSWHLTKDGETVAHVEGIEKLKDGKPVMKGFLKKKPVVVYKVTNLPGADEKEFLTPVSALTYAADHHTKGNHNKVPHPKISIKDGIKSLESMIWKAASDPRMNNEEDQHKLLQVSKSHAKLRDTYNTHFGEK